DRSRASRKHGVRNMARALRRPVAMGPQQPVAAFADTFRLVTGRTRLDRSNLPRQRTTLPDGASERRIGHSTRIDSFTTRASPAGQRASGNAIDADPSEAHRWFVGSPER